MNPKTMMALIAPELWDERNKMLKTEIKLLS